MESLFIVFSPFYRAAAKFKAREPIPNTLSNFYPSSIEILGEYPLSDCGKFYVENADIEVRGG